MKKALVCGAGGFIGGHLIRRLKQEGYWVRGADLKRPAFAETEADDFMLGDLSDPLVARAAIDTHFEEIYQLGADMGGAGFISSGENDAAIMQNSAPINLNVIGACRGPGVGRVFYASSARVYPALDRHAPPNRTESSAYPAAPASEDGWEKLFSERLYLAHHRNHGLDVRIARYHGIFGPNSSWTGGREQAPAAICRKVAQARDVDTIEVWGDGTQLRSFLYIDDCIEGTLRLMRSDFTGPVNIGSEETVTIDQLVDLVADIAGKRIRCHHVDGPRGVDGRASDNQLIRERLGWVPTRRLRDGLETTYRWVEQQVLRGDAEWTGADA